jgi:serine/threonine protein kinase
MINDLEKPNPKASSEHPFRANSEHIPNDSFKQEPINPNDLPTIDGSFITTIGKPSSADENYKINSAVDLLGNVVPKNHLIEPIPDYLKNHSRYAFLKEIGRGGMGKVYLGENRFMRRKVAIKVVEKIHLDNGRFQKEVVALGKLDHPNIVAFFDVEILDECGLVFMEYLNGETLAALVNKSGQITTKQALYLTRQIAEALLSAHDLGIIHRDINPKNIFVTNGDGKKVGQVKVLDFGLAMVPEFRDTPSGYGMGTVGFIPPEQSLDARSVGIQADIFSLGRTLYFMLSGRHPYQNPAADFHAEINGHDPVLPLGKIDLNIPRNVIQLVEKMTAKKSQDRFQSCQELLDAIDAVVLAKWPISFKKLFNW